MGGSRRLKGKTRRTRRASREDTVGISAWLVTWEHAGARALTLDVAAILDPRLSSDRVREIVEILHANRAYTYRERIGHANRRRFNPYPATFGAIGGVPWRGRIVCGHNPHLFARLVTRLRVEGANPGSKKLLWEERPPSKG